MPPPRMPYGYSHRTLAMLVGLLVIVAGGVLVSMVFRGSREEACPRPFNQMELAALALWEGGGGTVGTVPEVAGATPSDLRPLEDPGDAEACRRLREALPDTLPLGLAAPQSAAFYQVGDVYLVPVVPNLRPSEIAAIERGDFTAERSGATYVFGSDFRLLATYRD